MLLFYALTGQYPASGKTLDDVRMRHEAGDRARLRQLRPDVSAPLAGDRAGLADPSTRYQSAEAFEAGLAGAEAALRRSGMSAQASHAIPVRRRFGKTTLAVIVAVAVIVVAGVWTRKTDGRENHQLVERGTPSSSSQAPTPHPNISPTPPEPPNNAPSVPVVSSLAGEAPQEPSIRQIRLPREAMGRPSRDGRFFPYVAGNGDVYTWELTTGKSRRVTETAGPTER